MPCDRVTLPDGTKGILCTRGGGRTKPCACGKASTRLCDYPLRRSKRKDATCSQPLCDGCAAHVGEDRDLCPAHAKMARAAGVAPALLADPDPHAMAVAADQCEQHGTISPGRKQCSAGFCERAAVKFCDFPVGNLGRTCARPICNEHAAHHGPDLDLCPEHAKPRRPRAPSPPRQPPPAMCRPGDGAAAVRELEQRTIVRTRSDALDVDAVDFVEPRDIAFRPRDLADWQEYVTERAAIYEYLGEMPRAVAEARARQLAGPPPRYERSVGPLFAGAR